MACVLDVLIPITQLQNTVSPSVSFEILTTNWR